MLAISAATVVFEYFFRKSDFANALFVSLLLCGSLVYSAYTGRYLDKWKPYSRWLFRFGAVVCGCWLFAATPTLAGRLAAVASYAALYLICEWMLDRRVQAFWQA
jgi:hypothetical protein